MMRDLPVSAYFLPLGLGLLITGSWSLFGGYGRLNEFLGFFMMFLGGYSVCVSMGWLRLP